MSEEGLYKLCLDWCIIKVVDIEKGRRNFSFKGLGVFVFGLFLFMKGFRDCVGFRFGLGLVRVELDVF